MMRILKTLIALGALCLTAPAFAADEGNNGTDPTKLTTSAELSFEHMDLGGGLHTDTMFGSYTLTFNGGRTSLRFRVPVVSNNFTTNSDFGLGDVSLRITHVSTLTRTHGIVLQGEIFFDTADQADHGTGKTVLKASVIYAKFLKNKAIFAPAFVQSVSIGGDAARADVNTTTLDFYYVPKFKNPKVFVTFDPALTSNWEADKQFASLAITVGYGVGKMFGGNGQVYIKPTFYAGNDRPADWGVEAGFKTLGF